MKKILIIVIAGILLLGFAARLYKFDNPVADWHSPVTTQDNEDEGLGPARDNDR